MSSVGMVILLNGTSSSGKTSIANSFIERVGGEFHYVSLDNHLSYVSACYRESYKQLVDLDKPKEKLLQSIIIDNIIYGFHDIIAAHAAVGIGVIVDHVLHEERWKIDLFSKIKPYKTMTIGLDCSLGILEEREKERLDREIGLARYQFERVHKNIEYDISYQTDVQSVGYCVDHLINTLKAHATSGGFSFDHKN